MRRQLALAAAVLLLAGCATPAVSTTPPAPRLFATEADALEAVDAVLDAYLQVQSSRLRSTAPEGQELLGSLSLFGLELRELEQDGAGARMRARFCVDYRTTIHVRSDGIALARERDWAPFEAHLTADADRRVVLDELQAWSGDNFCDERYSRLR